jgi:EAL domain-containing protein (putative c-di-GMP-specific phosphodiesterase class I)
VAEGVETGHQAQVLRKIGCDELQGFLFAPAIPAEELVLWNRARQDEALDASPA